MFKFDPAEVSLVRAACATADTLAGLEAVIEATGMTVAGSTGQLRVNPAVAEARQQRLALARLLGALALPDADDRPMSPAARQASKAATSRWKRTAELRGGRRGEASR